MRASVSGDLFWPLVLATILAMVAAEGAIPLWDSDIFRRVSSDGLNPVWALMIAATTWAGRGLPRRASATRETCSAVGRHPDLEAVRLAIVSGDSLDPSLAADNLARVSGESFFLRCPPDSLLHSFPGDAAL